MVSKNILLEGLNQFHGSNLISTHLKACKNNGELAMYFAHNNWHNGQCMTIDIMVIQARSSTPDKA